MLKLKNRLFQPLVLHRGDGTTVHLLARGAMTIRESEMSDDIRRAVNLGQVSLIPEAVLPSSASENKTSPAKPTRRKGARR